jgi:hypothetical protein
LLDFERPLVVTSAPVAARVKRTPSPAQIAIRVTYVLKGHLKNARIAYVRAAVLLARVRDEKLWRALRHPTIEDYAQRRLGLRRTALYQYLRIHDWLRDYHPKKRSRIPCHSSAPTCSARSIDPFTSAKSTVTCFRSPSNALRDVRIFSTRCFGV